MDDARNAEGERRGPPASLVLWVLGLPSVLALLGGTLLLAGALHPTDGTRALIEGLPILAGGFAGVWGAEVLRRGDRSRVATAAATIGVLAFLVLIALDVLGATPYGLTPWTGALGP